MKKSAKTLNDSKISSTDHTVECSPWDEIKHYDSLHNDRKIAPREIWENGFQLVTSVLVLTLICSKSFNAGMTKMAYDIAWTLPMPVLDHATELAESLGALYYFGGFFIKKSGKKVMVFKSKRESKSFLKSVKLARPATGTEIEAFLYEKAFNTKLPDSII